MTTQLNFKIEKSLKKRAQKQAQIDGLPLTSILKLATRAYVDGNFKVALVQHTLNPKTKKILKKEIQEIREGTNLSTSFKNSKDAVAYLENL